MKKLLVLSLILLFSMAANAQIWFDVGLKGGGGTGFLLNKTMNNDGRLNVTAGYNYFFGGKVGINYGQFVGLTCDVDYGAYSCGFTQSDIPSLTSTESYKYTIKYSAINVMPMFRFTKEASYLEVGPQFSFVRNPGLEDEAFPGSTPVASEAIRPQLTGITFGFGAAMVGNEIISLMMGLRGTYVVSDLRSNAYADANFPFSNYTDIPASNKTNPLTVQLVIEVNYSLGYIARSTTSCGKRAAFKTF